MATKIPMRMCLGCRTMKPKTDLIRIVRSPDGKISIDKTLKLSGRGAYVCNNSECFKRIIKSRAVSRTLKTEIPEDIYNSLQENLNG
ncbi:MAG: YlxR family protein [Oscillospiraceae bacterium]|nr:YlxR family protein [Oscillospiraceae bacterium]